MITTEHILGNNSDKYILREENLEVFVNLDEWLQLGADGYFGDYYDKDGNYCIQSLSVNTVGLILKSDLIGKPIQEIISEHIIIYIPMAICRVK